VVIIRLSISQKVDDVWLAKADPIKVDLFLKTVFCLVNYKYTTQVFELPCCDLLLFQMLIILSFFMLGGNKNNLSWCLKAPQPFLHTSKY